VLDIGGDKLYSWEEYKEANPFLGWRGIRILLEEKNLLKTQLRAILRASACGNVKILLPMISSIDEVMDAKKILEETKEELRKEGKEFDEKIELGVMVEIPSCALLAREMGKFVDFFSIGSNDLTQYTLAVDRTNERISYLFSHLHPAVLKLMKLTVEGGHENGKWVGVCGEIAGDPLSVPVLLGLGVDELSTSPIIIPEIKSIIRGLTMEEARSITEKVMRMNRVEEIRRYLREEMAQRFPLLINLFVEEEDAGDNR
ncbi:phosphoenolpyruvate--protein phosphotransferase, partial [bacterium]